MKKKDTNLTPSSTAEPLLGIFWLVEGTLVIDSVPFASAVPYGGRVTHPADHIDLWEVLKGKGRAPQGSEYEQYPRGRTIHDLLSGEVTILGDRCILQRKDIVKQIKDMLRLPKNTMLDTDEHYRCNVCLYARFEEEEDNDEL